MLSQQLWVIHEAILMCPEETVALSLYTPTVNFSIPSSEMIKRCGRRDYDIDVSFKAEHSLVSHSLPFGQLGESVLITNHCK